MGSAKIVEVNIQLSEDEHMQLQSSGLTLMEAYGLWLWHKDKPTYESNLLED